MRIAFAALLVAGFAALIKVSAQTNASPAINSFVWEQKMDEIRMSREITYKKLVAFFPYRAYQYRQTMKNGIAENPPPGFLLGNGGDAGEFRAVGHVVFGPLINPRPSISPDANAENPDTKTIETWRESARNLRPTQFLKNIYGPETVRRFDLNNDGVLDSVERALLRNSVCLTKVSENK
jgi:hypothetical protein